MRRIAIVLVAAAACTPAAQIRLELPVGERVTVPESSTAIAYAGIGHAMLVSGECVPFVSYRVEDPDGSEDSHDTLVGMRLGPWTVASVDGEWAHDHLPPQLGPRLLALLRGDTPPRRDGVIVTLRR